MKSFLLLLHREFTRPTLLLALLALLFALDAVAPSATGHPELSPLLMTVALVVGGIVVVHFTRRILFHRLDLQTIALKACETSGGAGLVFLSVVGFMAVVLSSIVAMLR